MHLSMAAVQTLYYSLFHFISRQLHEKKWSNRQLEMASSEIFAMANTKLEFARIVQIDRRTHYATSFPLHAFHIRLRASFGARCEKNVGFSSFSEKRTVFMGFVAKNFRLQCRWSQPLAPVHFGWKNFNFSPCRLSLPAPNRSLNSHWARKKRKQTNGDLRCAKTHLISS